MAPLMDHSAWMSSCAAAARSKTLCRSFWAGDSIWVLALVSLGRERRLAHTGQDSYKRQRVDNQVYTQ